jgi:serine/threonine protein kinase
MLLWCCSQLCSVQGLVHTHPPPPAHTTHLLLTPSPLQGSRMKEESYTLVAQPCGRANSFVGTEEYLAPEIINAGGHCGGVDWWSFGILLHELVYGTTPFRGTRRDETFDNILKAPLQLPAKPSVSEACQDLMSKLLVKDPAKRLGSMSGAEEIKAHPWFEGINWALLRNETPPYIPKRGGRGGEAGGAPQQQGAAPIENF